MSSAGASFPTIQVRGLTLWHRIGLLIGRLERRLMRRLFNRNAPAVAFWLAHSPFLFSAMATLSRFRVFDRLRDGPQTAKELALALDVDEEALLRLLCAVSAFGLLKRRRDGRFALNNVARQFCSDSPNPLGVRSDLLLHGVPRLARMPDAVRTGQPLMKLDPPETFWEFIARHGATELHDRAMSAWSEMTVDRLASAYDFSKARTIVDVGGGRGALLAAILRAAPHLRGTVYDRENTRDEAMARFRRLGVADRAEHMSGNFFESVPAGADLYSIKHVLHDWDDNHVRAIFQSVRAAIPPHGRLLIIEGAAEHELLPGTSVRELWNLVQWSITWGKSRTLEDFQALLQETGFRLDGVVVTPTIDGLILEAVPVPVERGTPPAQPAGNQLADLNVCVSTSR